ncbi:hypothetical protein [Ahrensia kielensis]|uniref:hypothetical protein n=1 Tax=Ahrensia kielensis TaxID=76980 RepID=UPI00036AC1C5|nr:hypothetical protein [Ahrensia kielensis]
MEPKLIQALLDGLRNQAKMLLEMNPQGEPFTKAAIDNLQSTLKVVEKLEDFAQKQDGDDIDRPDEETAIKNVLIEIEERIEQLARKRADAILLENEVSCDCQKSRSEFDTQSAPISKTA